MGEQRHYRRPSQHKRRPPQTVMPCGSEDTPERQSEHRAETEKQPPRQPRKRLVQKPTPKSRQNPPEQWAKWRGQALDSAKQCAKRGAKRAERGLLQAQLAVTRAKRRAERRKQKKQAEQDSYLGAFSVGGRKGRKTRRLNPRYAVMAGLFCVAIWSAPTLTPAQETRQTVTPVPETVKTTQYQRMGGTPLAQMEALHAQNTDLVAWLTIDNVLDLPVVYRNNSYYLTHDFAKNKSTAGTIFLDENHPMTEKTQNLLLHGHNMKDGTMFGRLTQYEKSIDYLKAHPFVDFSTLWHQERYVIFAVVDVSLDTSSENFLDYFAHPRFSSDAEFASYIRRAELASMYAIPMDVKPSDALLTLSTCLEENRLVVIARRQRDGESKASLRETVNMAVRQ